MKPVDMAAARLILDFSGGQESLKELAELQLQGAVSLQNMLADPNIGAAYLADEVGMGKTYIALGAVALMRYFNPSLRVLYICPSLNVQEKWYGREHSNFIRTNVLTRNFNIRTPQGESGTPAVSCNNIRELITAATTGYYGDVFTRMSIFSIGMRDDEESIEDHLKWLRTQVPGSVIGRVAKDKKAVKRVYAKAINYLLPRFDLVVIDEAHNFKHNVNSSARNEVLSHILGTHPDVQGKHRRLVDRALLLSATPFDVNPEHLYNQLALIGKETLMPEREKWRDKSVLRESMRRFMVRRLNELNIAGERNTRNMYRREWRSGEKVEVGFETDEHKLITALVQKQVGEMLDKQGGSPCFQLGMLASFESYAQTARSESVKFDGDVPDDERNDARDRHVVAVIRDSYVEKGKFGRSLPHPKMDQVSRDVGALAFGQGRKQLVFVRRVKSVGEFKTKLDDLYNEWLEAYCRSQMDGFVQQCQFLDKVFAGYEDARRERDEDVSGGFSEKEVEESTESPAAKADTLFSWFIRGKMPDALKQNLPAKQVSRYGPEGLRESLTTKTDNNVLLFELDWFGLCAEQFFGCDRQALLGKVGTDQIRHELAALSPVKKGDRVSEWQQIQKAALLAAVRAAEAGPAIRAMKAVADYLTPELAARPDDQESDDFLLSLFDQPTFWDSARQAGIFQAIFGTPDQLRHRLEPKDADPLFEVHRLEVHRQLVAQAFRTGHPFIDLYLARLRLGDDELSGNRRRQWMEDLCRTLAAQAQALAQKPATEGQMFPAFCSYQELTQLNDNLDLVIKSNLADFRRRKQGELRRWLAQQLPSSTGAPVIGANGDTRAGRSVQARKFRMPGYPLVLVSTNVFQEGEDLHTFCDSVVHYGLSSSPVSIEQKTGRVDRVGAAAHRRLLRFGAGSQVCDDDYIQVSFPFVRQSIEAVQVRKLCTNLNAFLGSLHEIGDTGKSIDEFVDQSVEMLNRNEIPGQLMELLESPYIPSPLHKDNSALHRSVIEDSKRCAESVSYVTGLVSAVAGVSVHEMAPDRPLSVTGVPVTVTLSIDSARSSGELLLRVSAYDPEQLFSRAPNKAEILRHQAACYSQMTARSYAIHEDGALKLYRDVEMLVGNESVTCGADIEGHFQRLSPVPDKTARGRLDGDALAELDEARINRFLRDRFNWPGHVTITGRSSAQGLKYSMNDERQRHHHIRLYRWGDYCGFEATVAKAPLVQAISDKKLLNATWVRNRNIDLVEFLVRPDGDLVGRAFHPLDSMGFEELVFTSFILAAEADRLEYLLKGLDEF